MGSGDVAWKGMLKKAMNRDKEDKLTEEQVREIFNSIDKDLSGNISKKVLKISSTFSSCMFLISIGSNQGVQAEKCGWTTWYRRCGGVAEFIG